MVIIMRNNATEEQISSVVDRVHEVGLTTHLSRGVERTVIGVLGHGGGATTALGPVEGLPGVDRVVPVTDAFKLSNRQFHEDDTIVTVNGVEIGGEEVVVIGGPCSVESREQTLATAGAVQAAGARLLRGGAYKPRTSPYSFRGIGVRGLEILAEARERTGLGIVTEVMSVEELTVVSEYADMLQIGTRNMQNYNLLEAVGRCELPVLLKRGKSAPIDEWLLSAEYIMAQGNRQVVLCERGITSFDAYTRNTFDVSAIPVVQRLSHLPVIGDPSQATGRSYLVKPAGLAAIAAGADGLIVEVHPSPDHALSDASQQLTFEAFAELMRSAAGVAAAVGRACPASARPRLTAVPSAVMEGDATAGIASAG